MVLAIRSSNIFLMHIGIALLVMAPTLVDHGLGLEIDWVGTPYSEALDLHIVEFLG